MRYQLILLAAKMLWGNCAVLPLVIRYKNRGIMSGLDGCNNWMLENSGVSIVAMIKKCFRIITFSLLIVLSVLTVSYIAMCMGQSWNAPYIDVISYETECLGLSRIYIIIIIYIMNRDSSVLQNETVNLAIPITLIIIMSEGMVILTGWLSGSILRRISGAICLVSFLICYFLLYYRIQAKLKRSDDTID